MVNWFDNGGNQKTRPTFGEYCSEYKFELVGILEPGVECGRCESKRIPIVVIKPSKLFRHGK